MKKRLFYKCIEEMESYKNDFVSQADRASSFLKFGMDKSRLDFEKTNDPHEIISGMIGLYRNVLISYNDFMTRLVDEKNYLMEEREKKKGIFNWGKRYFLGMKIEQAEDQMLEMHEKIVDFWDKTDSRLGSFENKIMVLKGEFSVLKVIVSNIIPGAKKSLLGSTAKSLGELRSYINKHVYFFEKTEKDSFGIGGMSDDEMEKQIKSLFNKSKTEDEDGQNLNKNGNK